MRGGLMPTTKTLLIADDDHLVQMTYKHVFEEAGHTTGLASDGRETIAYLEKHAVDTVFLDVFMPDKDGLETLIEIKRRFPAVRVIVMSGGGMNQRYDILNVASKFGADGIVRKPVSSRELLDMLRPVPRPISSRRDGA
jgi:CheY-like chemotaxis protein